VLENRVLRRKFSPQRDEVGEGWGRLHNEELYNLYASSNTIQLIKLRWMRWTGQVARMGEKKMHTIFWLENLKGRDHLEEVGANRKIKLERILGK
jgi:hypothetical protein